MSDARKNPAPGRAGENSKQIYSHLSHSKEQLQDELADLVFQATEDEPCDGKLDALLDSLNKADPLPEAEFLDIHKSLDQFHKKYAPVFAAQEKKTAATHSSPKKRHPYRAPFKILPIAAVIAVLIGSVTCQALGVNILGVIARWTTEVFRLQSSSTPYATIQTVPLDKGEEAHYDSLEDAMEAFGVTAPIVPRWLPERFELVDVTASHQASGILICADYISSGGVLQVRYKEVESIDFSSLEQENDNVEVYFSGGLKHYLLSDRGRQKAVWQNGELECRISGDVTRQEIKKIVTSIYEGE